MQFSIGEIKSQVGNPQEAVCYPQPNLLNLVTFYVSELTD